MDCPAGSRPRTASGESYRDHLAGWLRFHDAGLGGRTRVADVPRGANGPAGRRCSCPAAEARGRVVRVSAPELERSRTAVLPGVSFRTRSLFSAELAAGILVRVRRAPPRSARRLQPVWECGSARRPLSRGSRHLSVPELRPGSVPQSAASRNGAERGPAAWGCKPKPRKFYNAFYFSVLIRYSDPQSRQKSLNRFGAKSV